MLAIPGFGQKLCVPQYYKSVQSIISVLRPASTLRTIADHLNRQGFTTSTGLPFTRDRVATFIRNNPLN